MKDASLDSHHPVPIDSFPVSLQLRLDWSEMDLFGHVNNVQYFKFIQAARVNFWEHLASMIKLWEQRVGPSLASTGCQFRKPLFYPGNIVVQSKLEFVKTTSFGIHHRILNSSGEPCAEAHDVVVLFDFNRQEKVPIPEAMRAEMQAFM
ncbi:MAG TPA: acyl-CoA thioesterase [Chitinophagales bacterium]|nr:acyl-CoA thioesterase [Chitinophagales bacterium]